MVFVRRFRSVFGGLALTLLLQGSAYANDLLDLYRQAQERDPVFLAARYARDALLEQKPQAESALLPQFTGSAAVAYNSLQELSTKTPFTTVDPDTGLPVTTGGSGTDSYNTRGFGLSLQQTLFDWTQFQALAQADALVAQAHAAYRAAEQELLFRVTDAYFKALNAEETLQSDLDAQAAYTQQLEGAQKKFDIGLATITDVRNAQAAFDGGSATIIADRRAAASARRALAEIVGQPVNSVSHLREEIPLEVPIPALADEWVDAALRNNPALLSFSHAADAAKKGLDSLAGEYIPRLELVGSIGREDSDYKFGSDQLIDTVGVQLSWKLYEGGLRNSRSREARAIYEQRLQEYEGQRRAVDKNARDAFEGVISGIASIKASRQSVLSYRTSLEASTIGLKVGARTQQDVLNAQRDLSNSQRLFYASRYDYLRSALALEQQAGTLDERDLIEIDYLLNSPLPPSKQVPAQGFPAKPKPRP